MSRGSLHGETEFAEDATGLVPYTGGLMTLTKTTTRALAASIAIMFAGATLAGAAVLHLPILGFRAAAASQSSPQRDEHPVVRHAAKPVAVVRVRYVDDIVHRPAPESSYPAPRGGARSWTRSTVRNTVASSAPVAAAVGPQLASPAAVHLGEAEQANGHDSPDHAPSSDQRSPATTDGNSAGDQ